MNEVDLETPAGVRYRLRGFLRFSERVTRANGATPLQYQLMLQIKGFPGRDWASVAALASGCRRSTTASCNWSPAARLPGGCGAGRAATISAASKCTSPSTAKRCLGHLARLYRDELRSIKHGFAVPGLADRAA
jgi:hypothetical protein